MFSSPGICISQCAFYYSEWLWLRVIILSADKIKVLDVHGHHNTTLTRCLIVFDPFLFEFCSYLLPKLEEGNDLKRKHTKISCAKTHVVTCESTHPKCNLWKHVNIMFEICGTRVICTGETCSLHIGTSGLLHIHGIIPKSPCQFPCETYGIIRESYGNTCKKHLNSYVKPLQIPIWSLWVCMWDSCNCQC